MSVFTLLFQCAPLFIREEGNDYTGKEALNKSKCTDWRADFSPDEGVPLKGTGEIADVLCVHQDFETKSGGKDAVKTYAAVYAAFP